MNKNIKYILYFSLFIIISLLYNNTYNNNNRDISVANNANIFNNLNYNINNNSYIINRLNDDEFNYILNKSKLKVKSNYTNIILITSKILVSRNIFSYISIRSIYSIENRYKQTIETINTIRKNIPDVCIFLIDNSNFENGYIYMHNELNNLCDVFINPLHDSELYYYTNVNKYKSVAEGYQIMYFLDIFNQLNIKYDHFFKISGRYYLNDSFNYDNYKTNDIIFSNDRKLNVLYYYTCFYMIPYSKINLYIYAYKIIYNNIKNIELIEQNIEYVLPMLIKLENIRLIDNLGVTQRIAIRDEISDI